MGDHTMWISKGRSRSHDLGWITGHCWKMPTTLFEYISQTCKIILLLLVYSMQGKSPKTYLVTIISRPWQQSSEPSGGVTGSQWGQELPFCVTCHFSLRQTKINPKKAWPSSRMLTETRGGYINVHRKINHLPRRQQHTIQQYNF